MTIVLVLLVWAFGIFVYFIPYYIANRDKKRNAGAIGALNFFLGWTLIGWVVALVWAMSKDEKIIVQTPAPIALSPQSAPVAARKKCPYCSELVLADANKCRFCGSNLGALVPTGVQQG
jgi:hypothetical protein